MLDFLIREGAGVDLRGPPNRNEISGLDLTGQTEERVLAGAAELRDRQEVANALATRGVLDEAQIRELEKLYEKFRDVRNHSREEHGFGGVDENQANCVIESVTRMMQLVFPGSTEQLMDHPFGAKAVEKVAQGLRGWL
jgi:4-hydroxy-L-threonine phosphate dehydrogenase PdxA